MKAAVPVPYIIAVVFAVIIIATVAYWYVTNFQKGTSSIDEAYCLAEFQRLCAIGAINSPSEISNYVPECASYVNKLPSQC